MKHHSLLSIVCGLVFTWACEPSRGGSPRQEVTGANALQPNSEVSSNLIPSDSVAATAREHDATPTQWMSPYPHARWRLASATELGRTALWMSHVLVRHRDVPPGVLSFQMGDWNAAPKAPERTR